MILFSSHIFHQHWFQKKKAKLANLANPYGLKFSYYLILKYVLAPLLSVILFLQSHQIMSAILLLLFLYVLPDLMIRSYIKTENIQLIHEISNIVQNIILSLSANMSLYESLKCSLAVVTYPRFKDRYEVFIQEYRMYHFNMAKAISSFETCFPCYEFHLFLSLLLQGEREGNTLALLENLTQSLTMSYQKVVKMKEAKRMLFLIFSTMVAVGNSFAIVAYPLIMELTQSFQDIFQ